MSDNFALGQIHWCQLGIFVSSSVAMMEEEEDVKQQKSLVEEAVVGVNYKNNLLEYFLTNTYNH